jgi:hypothetical protein
MNIATNNQARELLSLYDFSEAEQKKIRSDYDWMDVEDLECNYGFFRYRSSIYHLKDFAAIRDKEGPLSDWDGYSADSYFNGVLVRFSDDCESVIVGRFLC